MRFSDLFLIVPDIALLAWALQYFGQGNVTIILVLAGIFWMYIARVVRGQVLSLKEKEYVEAARAAGASPFRIITRHILPNTIGPIMVDATLAVAAAIITESTLSFLGFGVQPPSTSWGKMLSDAEGYVGTKKAYLLYFPGLAILLTVLAVNFLGDGLRDAFDPQSQRT
jgi:peptide/nickel transport system permease protein